MKNWYSKKLYWQISTENKAENILIIWEIDNLMKQSFAVVSGKLTCFHNLARRLGSSPVLSIAVKNAHHNFSEFHFVETSQGKVRGRLE